MNKARVNGAVKGERLEETEKESLNPVNYNISVLDKVSNLSVKVEKSREILEHILNYLDDFNAIGKECFLKSPSILSHILLDYLVLLDNGLDELQRDNRVKSI